MPQTEFQRSVSRLSSLLSARFHQRQVKVVRDSIALGREIRQLVARLAKDAVHAALDSGLNLRALCDRLDVLVRRAIAEIRDKLVAFGKQSFTSAVLAFVKAMPKEALAALLRTERTQEAEEIAVVARYELEGVPRSELEAAVQRLLFEPPSREQIENWLRTSLPGGKSWEERLQSWAEQTRGAFLTQITQGLAAGETPDQIEQRLRPFADSLGYKSERIARTEACRVAERANLAMCDQLGDMVAGQQIFAVMDEWTRPHHAARHGRIYWRQPDGVYRDDQGNPLPELPDEPNCRCMTVPVLKPPDALMGNPDAMDAFRRETQVLIPDPGSYTDWWERASEKERMTAVGVKRYQTVRKLLKRDPEWIDFLAPDGSLLSISQLRSENAEQRRARRLQVEAMLAKQRMAYRQVAATGWTQPIRSLPFALRGVASGELGAVERLKQYVYAEAEAVFRPDLREERRRLKWMGTVHKGEDVRKEIERRVTDWQNRAAKLVDIRRKIRESDLPEPRQRELLAAVLDLEQRQLEQAIEEALFLPEKMRATLRVVPHESLTEEMHNNLARAVRFVEGITSRVIANDVTLEEVTVKSDPDDRRGRYDAAKHTVYINPKHDYPVYVHELIHHIERSLSSEKREHIQTKFDSWTKGAKPEHLGEGYKEDEYYVKRTDGKRWPYDWKYTGKVWPETRKPRELLTMSAQALASDPVAFASEYPELFDLLIDVLRDKVP
ncbi:phage minor head protein [Thermogutta sp.]|jgi:SPP1 gp7 family putative phage head morphogenesis protein|uniref:phage minor head protein n=1 Tax=Thermogutta sp. TaxID=1962930 RepID=UPI00321FB63C